MRLGRSVRALDVVRGGRAELAILDGLADALCDLAISDAVGDVPVLANDVAGDGNLFFDELDVRDGRICALGFTLDQLLDRGGTERETTLGGVPDEDDADEHDETKDDEELAHDVLQDDVGKGKN